MTDIANRSFARIMTIPNTLPTEAAETAAVKQQTAAKRQELKEAEQKLEETRKEYGEHRANNDADKAKV